MATDLAPFAGTVRGGFLLDFITGYAIKKVMKLAGNSWSVYCFVSIFRIYIRYSLGSLSSSYK